MEASDIAEYTRDIIHSNKMADIVTVFHGKVEEVQIPAPVDLIISEWMGTILLVSHSFVLKGDNYIPVFCVKGRQLYPCHCGYKLADQFLTYKGDN